MFILIRKKERVRGHVLICRRGKECRCKPRCYNRPNGYDNQMVSFYERVVIKRDGITISECSGINDSGIACRNVNYRIDRSYMERNCMIYLGLCFNSSKLFPINLSNNIGMGKGGISYTALSILLKNPEVFNHIPTFYYNEVIHIKKKFLFLLAVVHEVFDENTDIHATGFIKLLCRCEVNKLLEDKVDERENIRYYYC
jgi:hypothetical protein